MAASCAFPKGSFDLKFDKLAQAWCWEGPAQWKLYFNTTETKTSFEGLLMQWKMFKRGSQSPPSIPCSPRTEQLGLRPHSSFGSSTPFGGLSSAGNLTTLGSEEPVYRINGSDFKFLDHINSKIRQESNNDQPDLSDPKGLATPLSEETFERLIQLFEVVRLRIKPPQVMSEQIVASLCQKCSWAPNRAVGIAVFRYWIKKIHRKSLRAASLSAGNLSDISNIIGAHSFGLGSGLSAMTLQDLPSNSTMSSEEIGDNAQAFGVFHNDSHRPSLAPNLSYTTSPRFPQLQGHDQISGQNQQEYQQMHWEPSHIFAPPSSSFAQQNTQEWDPLDPQNLAKIADPNSTQELKTSPLPSLGSGLEQGEINPVNKMHQGISDLGHSGQSYDTQRAYDSPGLRMQTLDSSSSLHDCTSVIHPHQMENARQYPTKTGRELNIGMLSGQNGLYFTNG